MRETLQRDPFWTGGQKVPWLDLRGGVSSVDCPQHVDRKKARVFTGGSGASSQKQARTWASRQIPQPNEEIHAMHRN